MGLIAHYRLDGDATDAVGDNHGTANNMSWVDGKLGQAGDFNGSNGWIDCGNLGKPYFGSISIWYKKDTSGNTMYLLDGRGTGNWWFLSHYNGYDINFLNLVRYNGVSVEEWHHAVVTASPDETRLYINGGLVDVGSGLEIDFRSVRIGTRYSNSGYLDGLIDDVRIYDHALSAREVRDLSLAPALQVLSGDGLDNTADAGNTLTVTDYPAVLDSTSIAFWIYPTTTSRRQTFWDKGYGGEGTINFETTGGLRFYSGPNGGNSSGYQQSLTDPITLNQWHHVVIVRDIGSKEFRWYLAGEVFKVEAHTLTSIGKTDFDLQIGTGYTSDFIGKLRDVKQFAGVLTPAQVKELYQQRASIDSEGSIHTPLVKQNPRARYIRDWTNGSTSNSGDHWLEVRALFNGENVSLNKPVTSNGSGTRLGKVTDGTTSNSGYADVSLDAPAWVQVDLEEVREIDEVQVWHYNSDGRTYYDTKTEISEDGINWTTIFDSAVSGTYQETTAGVTHQARALGPVGATHQGLRLPGASEVGVTRGLVAWYPLMGDTLDYAGVNHAVNNGAVATAEGYEFSEGDEIVCSNLNVNIGKANELSVHALIKPEVATDSRAPIAKIGRFYFQVYGDTRLATYWYGRSPAGYHYSPVGSIEMGVWQSVCVVWSSSSVSFYVNGNLVNEIANVTGTGDDNGYFQIGYENSNRRYKGAISDVRAFNSALTPEEVAMQAKFALNTKTTMSKDCLYTQGQFKEVIA